MDSEIAPEERAVAGVPPAPVREFRWHVVARMIVTASLALAAILFFFFGYVQTPWTLLAVCGAIVGYNALLFLTSWHRSRPESATLISLILDLGALTTYLHFSGDIENPLFLAYSLPVVAGAVLLSRRSGFLLAGIAVFLFVTLILMTTLDAFPVHLAHHHLALVGDLNLHDRIDPDLNQQGWNYILTHTFVLTAVLFGSAHGFGTFSERLRNTERDLRHENERLLLLLSILPEGVVLLAPDGTILHANPAAKMLLSGSDPRSILTLDRNLGVPERFAQFVGPSEAFESNYHGRTLEHALARRSSSGPIVWVFRDATDQRRLMAQVLHRSKMIDLGLLAAGIAHEIGNPLSSMSAILQVMEMKRPSAEVLDRVRSLNSHVDRISRIVQDVTSFARPSAGRRSSADARALVAKALQIFQLHDKAKELQVERKLPNDIIAVEVIEDQIVQILLNLLLNAADACGGRGNVEVTVEAVNGEALLSVGDHGVGISEDGKRHLFTPFYTTKEQGKGVGMGLFISESIARGHGGRIDVVSAAGKGSVFTLRLPLASRAD
jgi:signal transduction histidine kinase